MTTRYTLVDQLHFLASVPERGDTVVTLQHWSSSAKKTTAVYVVAYNGVQNSRRFLDTDEAVEKLVEVFEATRADHAADLLTDERASTEVVRRGGPKPRYCVKVDCPATIPVPYAAEQCAAGDPVEGRGRIEFLSVTQRGPVLTVVTGGKR